MTRLKLMSGFIGVFLIFSAHAEPQELQQKLDQLIPEAMEQWQTPGLAVAVIEDGELSYLKGFGSTALKQGQSVDKDTLFSNASTTKAMVAAGIALLVDEGKLKFDDPLIKHLPEIHFKDAYLTQNLTLRDMLSHRSGFAGTDYWAFWYNAPHQTRIKHMREMEPAIGFRSGFIYQNSMYYLLGKVIERVSGKESWFDYLEHKLFEPLNMKHIYPHQAAAMAATSNMVKPHGLVNNEVIKVPSLLQPDATNAAGSVWSSIESMSHWMQFLLSDGKSPDGKQLISQSSFKELFKAHNLVSQAQFYPSTKLTKPNWTSYGFGWFQQDFKDDMIQFHTGSLPGLSAIIGLNQSRKSGIVVLQNLDHSELRHALLWQFMDHVAGNHKRDWNEEIFTLYQQINTASEEAIAKQMSSRVEGTSPSKSLNDLVGHYSNPLVGPWEIYHQGKEYRFRMGQLEGTLEHWHFNSFRVKMDNWMKISFLIDLSLDSKGNILGISSEFDRETLFQYDKEQSGE